MGFSRRNFSPHFPRECLTLGKLSTPQNTVSTHCYLYSIQHPQLLAHHLPPGSFNTETENTWIFPRASFSSRNSPVFPEQGERSLQSAHRKMTASARGLQWDILLELFTNWLYLKLPWGVGAGRKEAPEKTFTDTSEEPLRSPKAASCLNTSNPHSQMPVHTQYMSSFKFHPLLRKGPERVKLFQAKAWGFSIKMLQMEITKFHFSAPWCGAHPLFF